MRESLKIYDYIRSSAAYRVRIALNLKGLRYEQVPINLLEGEQRSAEYEAINPQRLVPALESEAGILTQSLAIIEYLDERYTDRPLLSDDAWQRARQRALSQVIACDIHPLNNLRVLNYLRGPLGQTEEAVHQWMANWTAGQPSGGRLGYTGRGRRQALRVVPSRGRGSGRRAASEPARPCRSQRAQAGPVEPLPECRPGHAGRRRAARLPGRARAGARSSA